MLEILRVVREEEPPRPSTKLSTAEALPSISANRGTEPKKLTGLLRNELDRIVMKALEKDRIRRYETANGFAADVLRYLAGEPVQAVPPSLSYRLGKSYRRNKTAVFVATAIFAVLTVGLTGTLWQAHRAALEAALVRQEQQKTQDALDQAKTNQHAAEVALCRSFLRPIGYTTEQDRFDPAEIWAFRDAARENDELRLLAIKEALADPPTALRVARRVERFTQATVGASPTRRRMALDLITPIQHDDQANPNVRLLATWMAIELHSPDWTGFTESIRYLATLKRGDHLIDWHNFLTPTLVERIDPPNAAVVADALTKLFISSDRTYFPFDAKRMLALIAPRLDSTTVTQVAVRLVSERTRIRHGNANGLIVEFLPTIAEQIEPAAADVLIDQTLTILKNQPKQAEYEEIEKRKRSFQVLATLAPRASNDSKRKLLAFALAEFAEPVPPKRSSPLVNEWAEQTTQLIAVGVPWATDEQTKTIMALPEAIVLAVARHAQGEHFHGGLVDLLHALSDRLDPVTRLALAEKILAQRTRFSQSDRGAMLGLRLMEVLSRQLPTEGVELFWERLIDFVILGIRDDQASSSTNELKDCAWIRDRIPPAAAEHVIRVYLGLVPAKLLASHLRDNGFQAALFLIPRLTSPMARTLAKESLERLAKDAPITKYLANHAAWLVALFACLPEAEAKDMRAKAITAVLSRMKSGAADTTYWGSLALKTLWNAMEPDEQIEHRSQAVSLVLRNARLETNADENDTRLQAIGKLTSFMNTDEANRTGEFLLARSSDGTQWPLTICARLISRTDRAFRLRALPEFLRILSETLDYRAVLCVNIVGDCVAGLDPIKDALVLEQAFAAIEAKRPAMVEKEWDDECDQALEAIARSMAPTARMAHLTRLLQNPAYDHRVRRAAALIDDPTYIEKLLDHYMAFGPVRATLLQRLDDLRHPPTGLEQLARFGRENPAITAVFGMVVPPPTPCRYRTAWEYFP